MALLAGAFAIFLAAVAGVMLMSIMALRQAGMALNPRRPTGQRRVRGVLAALCGIGVVASAVAGYVGIAALMYYAQQ